eukprot:gene20678-31429_t
MFAADTPAIVAVITSHPDKVVEMSTLMMAGMAASQKEEGIKMYEACVNQSKPNEFAFIECYRDLKATATHSKEPHFKAMNKGMRSLLGGKPSLHILKRSLYAPATAPSPGSVVTTSTIQCIAQLKAAPGKEEEMEKVLASMIEPSNAETGCVLYELFTEPKTPGSFTFVEVWKDAAAQRHHSTLPHYTTMARSLKTRGLLGAAPVVRNFKSITSTSSKM